MDVVDPDSDPQHWSGEWIQIRLWIQILPFSQKDVERTEIKLSKKNWNYGSTDPDLTKMSQIKRYQNYHW